MKPPSLFARFVFSCAGLFLLAISSGAVAAEQSLYLYHPDSPLALGKGFEPNTLIQPKNKCLEFTEVADVANGAATATVFKMSVVKSADDLKDKLGVDFSLDARYLQAKANASFNMDVSSQFDSNSVNILIFAQSEFGTFSMKDPHLVPPFDGYIKNAHYDTFRENCGSQLVASVVKGVKIGILLTVRNVNTNTQNGLKVGAGAGYDAGTMSVDMQFKLNNLVTRSLDTGSVEVSVYAAGGEGVSDLQGIVTNLTSDKDALNKIQQELGNYLNKFSAKNAVPVKFFTKPFGFGFEDNFVNLWKAHYETKIKRIADTYKDLDYRVSVARNIMDKNDLRYLEYNDAEVRDLHDHMVIVEDYLDTLAELHRDCQYNVYTQNQADKPQDIAEFCKFDESKIPPFPVKKIPDLPILQSHGDPQRHSNLELYGFGVKQVTVIYTDNQGPRAIDGVRFQMPPTLKAQTYPVSLERYWGFEKSHMAGPLSGKVLVQDYFGRSVIYLFHLVFFPEGGAKYSFIDKFDANGIQEDL